MLNTKKKGQAAIEFLMTYGWMLLVVLIVGALIFSFVDFGSLLPNRVDLAGNVRASAADSFATGSDDNVKIVFTFTGSERVDIAGHDAVITIDGSSDFCNSDKVDNVDNGQSEVGASTASFINGQTGIFSFSCGDGNISGGLIEGDVLQGDIKINTTSTKTGLTVPQTGPIRLSIN
jgi:uncharacterized protein (UPF0333 family)